jgi:hypothetical protein
MHPSWAPQGACLSPNILKLSQQSSLQCKFGVKVTNFFCNRKIYRNIEDIFTPPYQVWGEI